MLTLKIINALKVFYNLVENKNINWILSGSTSLIIQGVDVPIKEDIDILTDKKGAFEIDQLLSKYRIQPPNLSQTDKYKSYYGIYNVEGVQAEIMGDFQYKQKDHTWSKLFNFTDNTTIKYKNMNLLVLTLNQELVEYTNTERFDKVKAIKEKLI